ncbi:MAG: hypothetical protein DI539_11120 [Flavobacterium psychrophilum]|nr:MAG: hypothetical protein DI539_11120 [Flavobacterium psychrophilum]
MKKHFLVVFATALALGSCSDNDTEDTNPNESPMTLNKTITYFPTVENFETRNVKYYDSNMHIVADSTYDASGNFMWRNVHTYNTSNYNIDKKDPSGVTIASTVEEYDTQGRLIYYISSEGTYLYTYEDNTVSVDQLVSPGAFGNIGLFTYNEDGYIAAHTEVMGDVITSATSLQFGGNTKPVALIAQGVTGALEQMGTFSYYPNSMPANLERSTVQINNEVLKALKLEACALSTNYHLQDFSIGGNSVYHSETLFYNGFGQEGYPQDQTITIQGQPFCFIDYFFQN